MQCEKFKNIACKEPTFLKQDKFPTEINIVKHRKSDGGELFMSNFLQTNTALYLCITMIYISLIYIYDLYITK